MHSYKSSFGQCSCRWCGRYRNNPDECYSEELKREVAAFAREHGRTWKSILRHMWMSGSDVLRGARNAIGPRGLDRITPLMLKRVEERS